MQKLLLRLLSTPVLTFTIILTALLIQSFSLFSQTRNFSPQAVMAPSPDFDGNGIVNFSDFVLFAGAFGSQEDQENYEVKYDLDSDGKIASGDFLILARSFGKTVNQVSVLPLSKLTVQTGEGTTNANGLMYWVDNGTDMIQSSHFDGSNINTLITEGLDIPNGIAIGGGKMYWADRRTDKIQRANLDGSDVQDLITTGLSRPSAIALDISGGKMYWVDRGTDKIQRANLELGASETTRTAEDLVTGLDNPSDIALDMSGGKMYWTDRGTDKIQRADLNGSNVEDLITMGLNNPFGIALDISGGKMYWTDYGTDKIQRANLELGADETIRTVEDLVTGLDDPKGMALDISGSKMYWTDSGTDKIQRADLNGSNVEDLVTGLDNPVSIVLDFGTMDANSAAFYVMENTTEISRFPTNDVDSGDSTTRYAITGGTDQSQFAINSGTGALTFTTAPDFEHPADAGGNNDYGVVVRATRGTGDEAMTVEKTVTVIVIDVLEPPTAPALPTVKAASSRNLNVTWVAPANTGPAISDYDVQYRIGSSGDFIPVMHDGTGLTTTLTGLIPNTTYEVQVRAKNDEGYSDWSASGNGTTNALGMYWVSRDTIQRANLELGAGETTRTVEDLVTGLRDPTGIALDILRGKMYWTDRGTRKILRANFDGSNIDTLITEGLRDPTGIALDILRGKMYWADRGTYKIQRANLELGAGETTRTVEDLVTGLRDPTGIALDILRGKMYWTDRGTDKIRRANLDGSDAEDLITTVLRTPEGIAIAGGKMYWADRGTHKIQRANLELRAGETTRTVEDLVTGLYDPRDIALDLSGGKIYWVDRSEDTIKRTNLELGVGETTRTVETLVTGLDDPVSIALDLGGTDIDSLTFYVEENTTEIGRLLANDVSYAITGGADQSQFAINSGTGALTFVTAPNFENPVDDGGDNEYVVVVRATSGTGDQALMVDMTLTVTVINVLEPPGKPTVRTLDQNPTSLRATWTAPENAGPPITDYDVRYKESGGNFADWFHTGPGQTTRIKNLKQNTGYEVQVRAINTEGTGEWSDSGSGTTVNDPPQVVALGDRTVTFEGAAEIIDLRSGFNDEHIMWRFAASSNDETIATVRVASNYLIISPVTEDSTTINVTATDQYGASATQTFNLKVKSATLSNPTVGIDDDSQNLTVQFTDRFGAEEARAYDIRVRQQTPLEGLRVGCVEHTNPEMSAADISIMSSFAHELLDDGTTYEVDYRYRGEGTCNGQADSPGRWSRVVEYTTSGTSSFNIEFVFSTPPTQSQRDTFELAASRWERLIKNSLPNKSFVQNPIPAGFCNADQPEVNDVVDDVRIFVNIVESLGVLGNAGVCGSRSDSRLPVLSIMNIDRLTGIRKVVIAHEIGHALGIGNGRLWKSYIHNTSDETSGQPGLPDTYFNGPLSIAAFNTAGGTNYTGAKVPVQNTVIGQGHWRSSVFQHELMTPSTILIIPESLSAITAQALADMGYVIDITQVDAYQLPAPSGSKPTIASEDIIPLNCIDGHSIGAAAVPETPGPVILEAKILNIQVLNEQ